MRIKFYFYQVLCFLFALSFQKVHSQQSPINIQMARDNFATMTNSNHLDNRIGYRFFEHEPLVYGNIPESVQEINLNLSKKNSFLAKYSNASDLLVYKREIAKNDHWVKQDWTYYLKPVSDGVEILLTVKTYDEGLPEYYGVQQCFRMSGKTNEDWRKKIAETSAFSEYDHWQNGITTSLSFVVRKGVWEEIPADSTCYGARTPYGLKIDNLIYNNKPAAKIGPYSAIMLETIDSGLVSRFSADNKWVSGIYWENTSHVTDHHPADCLHSILNIGNIPSNRERTIRGKIYWFEGGKSDLLRKFKTDFAEKN